MITTVTRGASTAVIRALWGADSPPASDDVACARCGALMDFTRPDPLGIGRTMQQCTNTICPDRVLRAVPVRHV